MKNAKSTISYTKKKGSILFRVRFCPFFRPQSSPPPPQPEAKQQEEAARQAADARLTARPRKKRDRSEKCGTIRVVDLAARRRSARGGASSLAVVAPFALCLAVRRGACGVDELVT